MKHIVQNIASKLQSVLYEDISGAIRAHHPSFLDYVENDYPTKQLHINVAEMNYELASNCLTVMKEQLEFNICKLPSSYLPNSEVPGLGKLIKANISSELQYASLYWSNHLMKFTQKFTHVSGKLNEIFLSPMALYWIEVLSLLQRPSSGISAMENLNKMALVCKFILLRNK